MLQSIIAEISANFNGIDYLGQANTYKGKNYIDGKPLLWEDNKGNYFYIVNRQISFKPSKFKSGLMPIYEFDMYIYTQCNNDSVMPYFLMQNIPNKVSVGIIKFEEVKKGTAIIVRCSYEDNSGCNSTNICVDCC